MKVTKLLLPLLLSSQLLAANMYTGVNLAGAGFGSSVLPGKHGTNYLWTTVTELETYKNAGFKTIRLPFLWERIQNIQYGPLNAAEIARLDTLVEYAETSKMVLILDLHNYGKYYGKLVGKDVPVSALSDVWTKLATRYLSKRYVVLGMMNEPHIQKADEWGDIAQVVLLAIRKTGSRHLVLVPGTFFTASFRWESKYGAKSNASALLNITDPVNNFAYEVHTYFDKDSSGTASTCVSERIGRDRLSAMTTWLYKNKRRAFLGEFGSSTNPTCLKALESALEIMSKHSSVWLGWTYWGAARWFGNYPFNIYSLDPVKYPQVPVLLKFVNK